MRSFIAFSGGLVLGASIGVSVVATCVINRLNRMQDDFDTRLRIVRRYYEGGRR